MGTDSKIEWTDHTFNPWIGCQKVSKGCKFCYAERDFARKPRWANCWGPPETTERLRTSDAYWNKPVSWQKEAERAGKPAKVFCASLADVFEDHPQVGTWRIELFENIIVNMPWLHWLILTKRPKRALEFFENRPELLTGNIRLGVSAETIETASDRVPLLLQAPAAVRFVSVEPMLEPVYFHPAWLRACEDCGGSGYISDGRGSGEFCGCNGMDNKLDWVIIGCESGPNRRPMEMEWALDLVRQCKAAGTACFVKQLDIDGRVSHDPAEWPPELRVREYPG